MHCWPLPSCSLSWLRSSASCATGAADVCRLGGQIVVPSRLMQRPEIVGVANRLGRSPAQVMLRWNIQRGASIVPKADELWQMEVTAASGCHGRMLRAELRPVCMRPCQILSSLQTFQS